MDIHVILPSMKKLPSTRGALLRGLKSKQASCFHDLYRSRSDCSEEAVFLNCRSLTKVKFSTDQVRPALGSGSCLIDGWVDC